MIKITNKGQALATFVIFIPVIIMIGTLLVDVGYAKYNGHKLDEITKEVLRYGLNHIDEDPYDKMVDLIYQNDSDIDNYKITIEVEKKEIRISADKATKGFFGSIVGKDIYKEKSSFVGSINEGKTIIERDD